MLASLTPKDTTSQVNRCTLTGDYIPDLYATTQQDLRQLRASRLNAYEIGYDKALEDTVTPHFRYQLSEVATRLMTERVDAIRRQVRDAWPTAGAGEIEHRVQLALQRDYHNTPRITCGPRSITSSLSRVRFSLPQLSFEITLEDHS